MAINKVKFGNQTLIDLTDTTATADKILTGFGAYGKDGVWMDGSLVPGADDGYVYQDQDNYVVLDDDEGVGVGVTPLTVTENGTYNAGTRRAYNPVTVNVPSPDFIVTITKNNQNEWVPDCTFAEAKAAYIAGKNIACVSATDYVSCNIEYLDNVDNGVFSISIDEQFTEQDSSSNYQWGSSHKEYVWNSTGFSVNGTSKTYIVDDATASPSDVLSGKTFYASDGRKTGTIATKTSSDMTVVGRSVTVPAGYYSTEVVKSVETMTLPTTASTSGMGTNKATIGRSTSTQYINIPTGYNTAAARYTISATPNGSATAPSSISGTSATVSTGTNTLTLTKSVSVTPSVTAGYISSGTAGNASVSLTANVTVNPTPTVSGKTVTTPAGYYTASKTTDVATGSATTPATTITANPTISVNSSGLITATNSKTQSVTPTVSAGYVSTGTAGTVTVSGSATSQLTTKGATTYTPTTTNQTIASGTYLTGAQTISGDSNLVAENIKKDVTIFGITGTAETEPTLVTKTVTPSAITQIVTPEDYVYLHYETTSGLSTNITVPTPDMPFPAIMEISGSGTVYNGDTVVATFTINPTIVEAYKTEVNGQELSFTSDPSNRLSSIAALYGSSSTQKKIRISTNSISSNVYINKAVIDIKISALQDNALGYGTKNDGSTYETFTCNFYSVLRGDTIMVKGTLYYSENGTNKGTTTIDHTFEWTGYSYDIPLPTGSWINYIRVYPDSDQVRISATEAIYYGMSLFKVETVPDGLSQVTVNGDADLVAGNIKKDVEIFGVTGTYEGSKPKLRNVTAVTPTTDYQIIPAINYYGTQTTVATELNKYSISIVPNGTGNIDIVIPSDMTSVITTYPTKYRFRFYIASAVWDSTGSGSYRPANIANIDTLVELTASDNVIDLLEHNATSNSIFEALTLSPYNTTGLRISYVCKSTVSSANGYIVNPYSSCQSTTGYSQESHDNAFRLIKSQYVLPTLYDGLSQVIISGDTDLAAENIKKDVKIFGVTGTYGGATKVLTVNPTTSQQIFTPNDPIESFSWTDNYGSKKANSGGGGAMLVGDVNKVTVGTTYKITGTVVAFDGDNNILDSAVIDEVIQLTNDAAYIYRNGAYLKSFAIYKSSSSYLQFAHSYAVTGNYGIRINISFHDATQYVGFSEVTVNAFDGYTTEFMKTYIEGSGSLHIDFPEGLTKIYDYAYYSRYNCTFDTLPETVTSIGEYAFRSCFNIDWTSLPSGVTYIGSYAFQNCRELALTSLPNGLTKILSGAFYGCTKLALTDLPSSITSIGGYAFKQCTGLTTISCDGAITTLSSDAFTGYAGSLMKLQSVSFPNMTISTLYSVFGSSTATTACQELEFADIGSTKNIGSGAFTNCNALKTLVLRRTTEICVLSNTSAFNNTPMTGYNSLTGTVYVPSALISTYQTASNWSTVYAQGHITFSPIEGSAYEI